MWHGFGEFSKTWETTPDAREGFQTIFLRRGFPVYLVDQPRRGGTFDTGVLPSMKSPHASSSAARSRAKSARMYAALTLSDSRCASVASIASGRAAPVS
jgi:hypothetical protein